MSSTTTVVNHQKMTMVLVGEGQQERRPGNFPRWVVVGCILVFTLSSTTFQLLATITETRGLSPDDEAILPTVDNYNTTQVTSEDRSQIQPRKQLPSFANGGVVFFLHIAKTGGVSIRNNFREIDGVRMQRCRGERQWTELQTQAQQILTGNSTMKETLFIEFHGQLPGLLTLQPVLEEWRELAAKYDSSLFTFTMVREPVAFYVSYFNFFWTAQCKVYCDRPMQAAVPENLLATAVPNHQTLWLVRDQHNKSLPVTDTEYQQLVDILPALDWIGTTETMQTTTLPLLSYMLRGNWTSTLPVHNRLSDPSNGSILQRGQLDAGTVDQLKVLAPMDFMLHDRVENDYRLSMWQGLPDYAFSMQ